MCNGNSLESGQKIAKKFRNDYSQSPTPSESDSENHKPSRVNPEISKPIKNRDMNPLQEVTNGCTMVVSAIAIMYNLLSYDWLNVVVKEVNAHPVDNNVERRSCGGMLSFLPLPVLGRGIVLVWPIPVPILAIVAGVLIQVRFSFVYHTCYATRLNGSKRIEHWSRRADFCCIHIATSLFSYALTVSFPYFLLSLVLTLESCYKQFEPVVNPRRNLFRVVLSILFYLVPAFINASSNQLCRLLVLYPIVTWLFVVYPLGLWSHSMFHLLIMLIPPILMEIVVELPSVQEEVALFSRCVSMSKEA